MKFSVNLFDELFGERIELEIPTPEGGIVKRSVTKKWFEKMEAEGKVSPVEQAIVRVHVLNVVRGCYVETWIVGKDVSEDTATRFRDDDTDALYALVTFKEGRPETRVPAKSLWDEAKRQMDALRETASRLSARP